MVRSYLAAIVLVLVGLCAAESVDRLVLGDIPSEAAHDLSSMRTSVEVGAGGQSCRRLGETGSITFTLACDPVLQNYLTVKLWGSDTVSGIQYLHLYDPFNCIGSYQDDRPEVTAWTSQPPFPGRFVYSTYLIPAGLTAGQSRVRLKLAGAQLGIYVLYSHQTSFLDTSGEAKQTNPGSTRVRPAGSRMAYEQLVYQANLGITEFLTWQKYGPVWDVQVAVGTAPAAITGALTFDGRGGDSSWTVQQWKEDIYEKYTTSNMVCVQALEAFGIAYNRPWSGHYQHPEMVNRVVAGLDFFRIAQGANGAFSNPWGLKWIGGPNRVNGAGSLEGFGAHALADAFLNVHQGITASTFDELVDEDDNAATPPVTRRASYVKLFKGIINHMLVERGHAPNQDRAQVHAMYQSNECLRILSPAEAWPQSTAMQWVYEVMGVLPCPVYGGYWESEKGLALEVHGTINGGYCGNYGRAALHFADIFGQMTDGDPTVHAVINREIDAFSNYLYVQEDADGYRALTNESVISWRPNRYPALPFPDSGVFNGLAYAALELNNAQAIRILQMYLADRRLYTIDCSASAVSAHYEDNTLGAIKMVDTILQVEALAPTQTLLPMESGQPFAWADEQAAGIVLQHEGARLYMTLNWRHDYCAECGRSEANARPNNIARLHYTTDAEDRIANIAMQMTHGIFQLYTCRWGDYRIAMNVSETQSFQWDVPDMDGRNAVDLVSKTKVSTQMSLTLPPRTTLVLYPGECIEHLASDINRDCYVNIGDLTKLAAEWLGDIE